MFNALRRYGRSTEARAQGESRVENKDSLSDSTVGIEKSSDNNTMPARMMRSYLIFRIIVPPKHTTQMGMESEAPLWKRGAFDSAMRVMPS